MLCVQFGAAFEAIALLVLSKLDDVASKIKAADFHRAVIGDSLLSPISDANDAIEMLANEASNVFQHLAEGHAAKEMSSLYWTLGFLIAATILAVGLVALLSKGIARRLDELVQTMDKLSHKDLSVSIPYLTDTNENGKIASALARFKEAMI